MPQHKISKAIVYIDDGQVAFTVEQLLTRDGWQCIFRSDCDTLHELIDDATALLLTDGRGPANGLADAIGRCRRLPTLAGSVPILALLHEDNELPAGASSRIPPPYDHEPLRRAIEQWTGPLADHDFRDLTNPLYRLTRLAGQTDARRLLERFGHSVEEALDQLSDGGVETAFVVHKLAGLAGLFCFTELSDLCAQVDRGESDDLVPIRAEAKRTLTMISRLQRPE